MWHSSRVNKKNIILIGFMGSGKSSVGALLAHYRNMRFMDTDKLIENIYNESINAIFTNMGEQGFRDRETQCLEKCLQEYETAGTVQKICLSTGGGIILRERNRELLQRFGYIVYLYASPETITERLIGDGTRPLLRQTDDLQRLYDKRQTIYRDCADVTIQTDHRTLNEIVQDILYQYDRQTVNHREGNTHETS